MQYLRVTKKRTKEIWKEKDNLRENGDLKGGESVGQQQQLGVNNLLIINVYTKY